MSPAAEIALIIIAVLQVGGWAVLAIASFAIYKQLRGLCGKATTLMNQAEDLFGTVRETATVVSERAERISGEVAEKAQHIADLSEQVAERVLQRVDTSSSIVQEAISGPMINLASVRAGVGKGLEVWQALARAKGGNGK